MNFTPVSIADLFTDIVETTRVQLQSDAAYTGGTTLNYIFGHPQEIVNVLKDYANVGIDRFPAIFLLTDFEEDLGKNLNIYAKVNLEMLICTYTKENYIASKRLEMTFKPILYKIYAEFMKQIAKSNKFENHYVDAIEHIKTDRYFLGKQGMYGNEGNLFDNFVDAIEINNLDLDVLPKESC